MVRLVARRGGLRPDGAKGQELWVGVGESRRRSAQCPGRKRFKATSHIGPTALLPSAPHPEAGKTSQSRAHAEPSQGPTQWPLPRVATLRAPRRPVLWSSLPTTRVALSPGPNIWSWVLLGGRACLLNGPGWLGVTSVPPCYATLRYTMLCLNFLSGCPANPSELRGAPALKGSRGELRKSSLFGVFTEVTQAVGAVARLTDEATGQGRAS